MKTKYTPTDTYYLTSIGSEHIYYGIITTFGEKIILQTQVKEEATVFFKSELEGAKEHLRQNGIETKEVLKEKTLSQAKISRLERDYTVTLK